MFAVSLSFIKLASQQKGFICRGLTVTQRPTSTQQLKIFSPYSQIFSFNATAAADRCSALSENTQLHVVLLL